jgi:3-hydroxyethyl bacteriochlorophyllide a dehydrogenase
MEATAAVLSEPEQISLQRLHLSPAGNEDAVVDIQWSGISTGTERLLWSGRMPPFPGMGYPLVPGYEAVGHVAEAGPQSGVNVGDYVFVPGASCFGDVRGLFGASASRLVVPGRRVVTISESLGARGILLALAATAYHAIAAAGAERPECIIGHGVLGRLLARITVALGAKPPVVWEKNPKRQQGAIGYCVVDPADDPRKDYRAIYDVSGDAGLMDTLVSRLSYGGEIVLAGFYCDRLSFAFPAAFMREARFRIATQWQPADLTAVNQLIASGGLSLDGLITHSESAEHAPAAYRTAFDDPACLKMILDWRAFS